jgi:lipoprotein-releasing system permease protein
LIAIVIGALIIAVLASVWPAQRAARLHPVKALRFE